MPSLLLTNAILLDPAAGEPREGDLLIRDGRIAAVGRSLGAAEETIDAAGRWVTPGLIDIHVHFREPGDEAEETIRSGSEAAVAGGFTTVCCMPNTRPPLDDAGGIEFILRQSAAAGLCNVLPVGCLTRGREGRELADIAAMWQAGAVAFSDDGSGVADAGVMRRALQSCHGLGAPIMQHCEEPSLSGGCINAGDVSVALGLPGLPPEAEELMIGRDVLLNRRIGCRYHVQHISTCQSVELIRLAKRMGLPVTAEAAPHHLLLTDEACRTFDANYKMNPPLRTAEDVAAAIAGLVDGTIDCLATDHAPHLAEEKNLPLQEAAFGILGLEPAFALYKKALLDPGHISEMRLIELMTGAPARIVSLKDGRGTLAVGSVADVAIIDPDLAWTVDVSHFRSKSRNCPFHGWDLTGRPTHTIVGGEVKWRLDG